MVQEKSLKNKNQENPAKADKMIKCLSGCVLIGSNVCLLYKRVCFVSNESQGKENERSGKRKKQILKERQTKNSKFALT